MKLRSPLVLDLTLWFATAMVFLSLYVWHFHNPPIVIVEHLYPVALLGACGQLIKISVSRLLPSNRIAAAISSLLWVSLLLGLAIYYWLVLAGLAAWGQVMTVELFTSYLGQASGLFDVIGVSGPVVLVAALVVWGALAYAYARLMRRLHGVPAAPGSVARSRRDALTTAMIIALAMLAAHRLDAYLSVSGKASHEPFRLSLFAGKPGAFTEEQWLVGDINLDARELEARARYVAKPVAVPKNVVLIVVDALRPDHLEPYGYARATTPYLKALVDRGGFSKVDNVHSSCSASSCGLASLASGRFVHELPSKPFTLSQVLKLHGYSIRMILGGDHTNFYNLRALYGDVDSYYDGSIAVGYYMNDDNFVVAQTRQLQPWSGKPVMLQYHLMSSHILGKRQPAYARFKPSENYATSRHSQQRPEFTNFYDNGVRQTDAIIEQILSLLAEKRYLDGATVVITGDHGEGLGEKGIMSHASGVDEEVLRIPLLISGLASTKAAVAPARPFIAQADIAPTILHELGLPIPDSWTGVPLQVRQRSERNSALIHFQMNELAGVFDGRDAGARWKYWINHRTKEEFLFDLERDPHELQNVLQKAPPGRRDEWRKAATGALPIKRSIDH